MVLILLPSAPSLILLLSLSLLMLWWPFYDSDSGTSGRCWG